jgi:hypothetical protein
MLFRLIVPIIVSFMLFSPYALAFEGLVQSFGSTGVITWGNGEIAVVQEVAGNAGGTDQALSPLVVRKVVSQARRQMLDMVLSVRIDGKQTVSAYLSGDSDLSAQVRGLIQNSLFQGPTLFNEGGTVRVSERFRGPLAELVLPTTLQFQSGIPPRLSTSMAQGLPMADNAPEEVGSGTRGYTGVVVDARGLKITPALAPVIFGQDGFGAYGPFLVSRTNAVDKGMVAYSTTDDPKVLTERAGVRPLLVKALSAYGSWRTDMIISASDARLMRAVAKSDSIANGCKVVIIVDAPEMLPDTTPATSPERMEGNNDA